MNKKEELRSLLDSTDALLDAMHFSIASVHPEDAWKYSSYKTFIRKYLGLLNIATPLLPNTDLLDRFDIEKIPSAMNTIAVQQKELFDAVYSNVKVLRSLVAAEIGYAEDESQKIKDFFASNLRKAIFSPPERESQVQDAIEILLTGKQMSKGVDYDRETGRVKVSGKEFVPDFIFPKLNLALEVKLCKDEKRVKSLIDEINADIKAYEKSYLRQLYIIYDLGFIRDETEFKHDLEKSVGVSVLIIKH